jgi:hypothetical protein
MFPLLLTIDPVQLVDKASVASDRWLFLAITAFMIMGFIATIRYLVKMRDKEVEDRTAERTAHAKWVETVYTENVRLTAQVLVVLQETNSLLKRLEEHLARARP